MIDLLRVAELELSCRAALPALEERTTGDWVLRVSGGETKRVNSANPLVAGARVEQVIAEARTLYAERDLPCRFRLTPLAAKNADSILADAGFAVIDRSITMVAPLTPQPGDPAMHLSAVADHETLARIGLLSNRPAPAHAVHTKLVNAIAGAKAFAILVEDETPVAAGYASVGHGRAQLSDIVVASDQRGRGLGRRLVVTLLGWAYEQGCREAMLQVLDANHIARGLYRSLGFVDAYPYHYRVRR